MSEMIMSMMAASGTSVFLVTKLETSSRSIVKLLWPCSKVMPNTSLVSVGAGT